MDSSYSHLFERLKDPKTNATIKNKAIDEIIRKSKEELKALLDEDRSQESVLAKLSNFWGKQSLRFKILVGLSLIAPLLLLSLLTHIVFLSFICVQMIILYTVVSFLLEDNFNNSFNKKETTNNVFARLSEIFQSLLSAFVVTNESLLETRDSLLETRDSLLETRDSLLETRGSLLEARDSLLEAKDSLLVAKECLYQREQFIKDITIRLALTNTKSHVTQLKYEKTLKSLHLVETQFRDLLEQFNAMKVEMSDTIERLTFNNTKIAQSLECANKLVASLNETLSCYTHQLQVSVQKSFELPDLIEQKHQDLKELLQKVYERMQKIELNLIDKKILDASEEPPLSSKKRFFSISEKTTEPFLMPLPGP